MTVVLFNLNSDRIGSMPKFEAASMVIAFRDQRNRTYVFWRLVGGEVWFRESMGIIAQINTNDLAN